MFSFFKKIESGIPKPDTAAVSLNQVSLKSNGWFGYFPFSIPFSEDNVDTLEATVRIGYEQQGKKEYFEKKSTYKLNE